MMHNECLEADANEFLKKGGIVYKFSKVFTLNSLHLASCNNGPSLRHVLKFRIISVALCRSNPPRAANKSTQINRVLPPLRSPPKSTASSLHRDCHQNQPRAASTEIATQIHSVLRLSFPHKTRTPSSSASRTPTHIVVPISPSPISQSHSVHPQFVLFVIVRTVGLFHLNGTLSQSIFLIHSTHCMSHANSQPVL